MIRRFSLYALLSLLTWVAAASAQTTTLSPADANRSVTFSAGNLVITSTAASDRGARGADPQTSGKYYFECQLTVQASTHTSCGVESDYAWATTVGANGNYSVMSYKDGSIWRGNASRGTVGGTTGTSDWLGVAVDLDNGNIWFRKNAGSWNNSGTADPATNTGGLTLNIPPTTTKNTTNLQVPLPIYPGAIAGANGDKVTTNFGATAFTQAVPSGFTAGWPTNPITVPTDWYLNASTTNVSYGGGRNLTASSINSSSGATTNYNRSTGKYYVEFLVGFQDNTYAVGVGNTSIFPYQNGTSANHGIDYVAGTGIVRRNNATQATYSTYTQGDVISEAVDLDNDRIWFRKNGGDWNGSALNDPATNVGGLDISAVLKPVRPGWGLPSGSTAFTPNAVTGRFGYYYFSYAAPTGFVAGWPVDGPQIVNEPGGVVVRAPLTHW